MRGPVLLWVLVNAVALARPDSTYLSADAVAVGSVDPDPVVVRLVASRHGAIGNASRREQPRVVLVRALRPLRVRLLRLLVEALSSPRLCSVGLLHSQQGKALGDAGRQDWTILSESAGRGGE